ncbi:MAG: hypothetical protein JKY67_23035 [Pseudomonadales bacterium]|nr:hypothetical protein [Pseudomonadales bacterium]MBL4868562.1 hypothetical protein [Pseudomonadales bacterium]MBL4869248.1 hypothetical protein [Pseudomonadales bacterium]
MDDEFYRNKMIKNLNVASVWLIEEGLYTFKKSGKNGLHRKLVDEWGVQIWVDPWIESERYIDGFWIKARGINHEVINFYRKKHQNFIYEFWVVKVDGKEWADVKSRAEFYVVKTDTVYGKREILKTSDQFIEEYEVDGEDSIRFPQDDLQVLYELQAWLYPSNFEKSKLKDKKLIMDSTGNIEYER